MEQKGWGKKSEKAVDFDLVITASDGLMSWIEYTVL